MVDRVCVCLISSIHWHILSILFYSHVHMFVWTSVHMSSYKYTYFAWLLAQLDNQLTVNRALSFSSPKNPTHTTPTRVLSRSRSLSRSWSLWRRNVSTPLIIVSHFCHFILYMKRTHTYMHAYIARTYKYWFEYTHACVYFYVAKWLCGVSYPSVFVFFKIIYLILHLLLLLLLQNIHS